MKTTKKGMMRFLMIALTLSALVWVIMGCAPAAPPAPTPAPTSTPAAAKPAATPTPVPPTATPKPVTVKWGSPAPLSDIGIYMAIEKGYFKEEGITVEIIPITTLSEQIPPLAKGDMDIATGGFAAPIPNAVLRGVPVKVIADAGGSNPPGAKALAITVRKDLYDEGKIRTAADLKGKKVAVTAVATMSKFFAPLLAEAKLTVKDIDFVPLSMPDTVAAYATKRIDAAFQMEPLLSQTVAQGLAVRWKAVSEYMPGMQTSVVLASPQFLQNKDVANRWMVAYLRGVRTYLEAVKTGKGIDEIINIAIKYTPLKDKTVYQLIVENQGLPAFDPDGRVNKDALIRWQLQHFLDAGYMTEMPDIESIVDYSLVDYAVQKLGKSS